VIDKNTLCISYEVSGIQVCADNASTADDIKLTVLETIPQKSHTIVGTVEILRVPSDMRSINKQRVAEGYSMANIMAGESDYQADIVAIEMDLEAPVDSEPYIQGLKENDIYVIKSLDVAKRRRNEGIGSCILQQLPKVLSRIGNDSNPVIAVVPMGKKEADDAKVINFFKKNGFRRVHAHAQTWYFC
jgi:GNAT superfamily N-acetyltransferase